MRKYILFSNSIELELLILMLGGEPATVTSVRAYIHSGCLLPTVASGTEHGNVSGCCSPSSQSQLKAASSQGQPPSKTAANQAWHDPAIATRPGTGTAAKCSLFPPPPHPPPPPSLWLSRPLLLPSAHESAASAKILLPSALVEACLSVCLAH